MCFSAGASFGASVLLSTIGATAIMRSRTIPQGLFAGIPLLFSIQQLAEGLLWLSLKEPQLAEWRPLFSYTFLIFALVVWPIFIPFVIQKLEEDVKRRKVMRFFLFTGALASVGAGATLLLYPAAVIPSGHHLRYDIDLPGTTKVLVQFFTLLYFAATIIPLFISSVPRMKWLGISFLITYGVTIILYNNSVVSVWCFLAAVLSSVVLWIISGLQESPA